MKIRSIQIDDDVADVLRRANLRPATALSVGVLTLPEGQLERKLYERVAKVLAALGLKWNRGMGGFPIDQALGDQLTEALDAGSVVDRKKTLELFETPVSLAMRLAVAAFETLGAAENNRPFVLLEPSAGRGRLLAGAKDVAPWMFAWDKTEIIAIDVDAANCEALRLQGLATTIVCTNFVAIDPGDRYPLADVILMNPPFASTADILHVTHAYQRWLKPGGVLAAIMSAHFTFAEDRPSIGFRDLMASTANGSAVDKLPEGSFKSEGTGVNAVLVTMRKPLA